MINGERNKPYGRINNAGYQLEYRIKSVRNRALIQTHVAFEFFVRQVTVQNLTDSDFLTIKA